MLIISALLIGFSSEFMVTSQTNTNYIRKFRDKVSAETLADAGLEISKYMLDADRTGNASNVLPGLNTNKNTDTFKDLWAIDFPEMPVEGGSLEIRIEDEQAKINLSALANEFVDKTPYYIAAAVSS